MRTTPKSPTFNSEIQILLPDLTRFARVLTRNEDDAHDLVQDCVERALRKQDLFQDGTSLKSWLFTLMRNLFVSQKRRQVLDRRYATMTGDAGPQVQRAGQLNTVFLKETMRALCGLSTSERQAIVVLGIHEGSQHHMAKVLREPVGTVKSRLCRGRAHLRSALGPTTPWPWPEFFELSFSNPLVWRLPSPQQPPVET